jgi:hypothetical protein
MWRKETMFALMLLGLWASIHTDDAFAQCQASALFAPSINLGSGATKTVVADVNEDGISDLVGEGVVGDFNGDGILDIVGGVCVNVRLGHGFDGVGSGNFLGRVDYCDYYGTQDSLVLYVGNGVAGVGDGTFHPGGRFWVGYTAYQPWESADLNGDSILDVIVPAPYAYPDSVAFSVLLGGGVAGVGDGTFSSPLRTNNPLGSAGGYQDIETADFDSDGKIDVLTANNNGQLRLFRGHGDGLFGPSTPLGSAYVYGGLDCEDLNSDAILDIVIKVSQGIGVLRGRGPGGQGDGTFEQTVYFPDGYSCCINGDILLVDLNHDGVHDVVAPSWNQGITLLVVYLGQGTGSGATGNFDVPVGYNATGGLSGFPVAADFNSDGMVDVLYSSKLYPGRCPNPVISAPHLIDVKDVSGDQGGKVSVTWNRSLLDHAGVRMVTGYTVWRRIPSGSVLKSGISPSGKRISSRIDGTQTTYWEPIADLRAQFLDGYGYTAETSRDSMYGSNPYTAFFVSALTEDPYVFFQSNVDSGYSVDNLVPGPVQGLHSYGIEPGVLRITWQPNQEPDISHYNIYKSTDPAFHPSLSLLVASPTDTSYVDSAFNGPSDYYKVTALDIHGNESRIPVLVTARDANDLTTSLFPPYAPAGGGPVQISYSIGSTTPTTRLEVFDVSGRRVRLIFQGPAERGRYVRTWDRRDDQGRKISRGLYLVRLSDGRVAESKKVVVTSASQ